MEKVALPEASGFDNPERLDAFLDAVRWGAASSADIKNVQAPFRAGIDIEDDQLDPVVRAIQMPRVNLLIADDVGLGKTIEAGMVTLELILRHRARRVLVLCPASLQVQWRDQMRDKFGLDFRIVDSELMRELRRKRGIHVNPWGHFPRLITSIDFLKRERPLRLFKETLSQEGQSLYPRRYDVLILDEAQNWLQTILASAGFTGGDRLMTMYGGMDKDQREAVKAAFQTDPAKSPVRILLATDAASEGIDLQNHCHRLIHYEIPFNPNRLEQRNGRIDRYGQRASEVLVYHFVSKGYKERENALFAMPVGDLEFLMRAVRKVETIREDLGEVGPVIAQQVEEAMLGRRSRLDTRQAEQKAGAVKKMLKFEQDLARRIKRLREELDETKREMRLSPENIQKVVEVALELAGQPSLIPAEVPGIWPHPNRSRCPVFRLPALSGSWGLCAQGLRHPHTGEVRPIAFDHAVLAEAREDVVLVHLNHRLVQMSLRLLRAEVWSSQGKKNLNRVTARLIPALVLRDPAIIAHARLVIVGGDSHRLHEEIITAGGLLQEGKFRPMNVGQVEKALEAAKADQPGESMKKAMAKE